MSKEDIEDILSTYGEYEYIDDENIRLITRKTIGNATYRKEYEIIINKVWIDSYISDLPITEESEVGNCDCDLTGILNEITNINTQITAINNRLNSFDSAITAINNRLNSFDSTITTINNRLNSHDTQITTINTKISSIETKINNIDNNTVSNNRY